MTKPLFIWAGGKTKMIKHYEPLMPKKVDIYVEPFFGGGAMLLTVLKKYSPKQIIINDINDGIVNIYKAIRNEKDYFLEELNIISDMFLSLDIQQRKQFFFEVRHKHAYDYVEWSKVKEAATLYFLMKTGFNGIFQINKNTNGRFGTPAGLLNQTNKVFDLNVIEYWNDILQTVEIFSGNWKNCISSSLDTDNTFFFFDPPYRGCFTSYGQLFDDIAQTELLDFCKNIKKSKFFLCNRDINDNFFSNIEPLQIHTFPITYTAGRRKQTSEGYEAKKATEILICNT